MRSIAILRQRGISMIMVLLVLILVALTALSASRSTFFNETITGNEADYNRALSAAEALIRDAQFDILGRFSAIPNDICRPGNALAIGCRVSATGVPTLAQPFIPRGANALAELGTLQTVLNNACAQGICAPVLWPANALPDQFWQTNLAAQTPNAATYGQFTQASPVATGNPILTRANSAWYWIEVIPLFNANLCTVPGCPATTNPMVYRITAVARGMRPNTLAAIQTYYVPDPQ